MEIKFIADVAANGEIKVLRMVPGQIPAEGLQDTGLYSVYVYDEIPVSERYIWIQNHYFDFENNEWVERPAPPKSFAEWNLETKTWQCAEEILLEQIRMQRDVLLTNCDWTQVSDNNLSYEKKRQWQSYRHVLRHITDAIKEDPSAYTTFDAEVTWPTPPE